MYQQIAQLLKGMVGNEEMHFDTAVKVHLPNHRYPVQLWGACLSPTGIVYVYTNSEEWVALDLYEVAFLKAIYYRLIYLQPKYKNLQTA